jgi:PadR family transcriptional regulator PadR
MYGWQLSERLISDGAIIGSIGTLYPVLTRLRERGDVSSYQAPSESGPPRRYYELTASGHRTLDAFRTEWGAFAASVTRIIEQETS